MDIFLLILLISFAIFILFEILFTKRGEYLTQSYKYNPCIDADEQIELYVVDPYLKPKSFFVNYSYSRYFDSREKICVTFIKIPLFHKKPRILDVYINNKKINID